jgi:hypothetical protein
MKRLTKMLDDGLGDPVPAVDALMTELGEGAAHPELWEKLHAAAVRDGVKAALADAYKACIDGPRMKRLKSHARTAMFVRAADYFENVVGDEKSARSFLENVLALMPGHTEAFARLERFLENERDPNRLLDLYARVAATPPKPAKVLATQALGQLDQLTPKNPLSDETCLKLVALASANPRLLDALDAHARGTKRHALACTLIEQALGDPSAPDSLVVQRRKQLLQLYMGEAGSPELAVPHVEALLERDPADADALAVGERLVAVRKVGPRAAAALRNAHRKRG